MSPEAIERIRLFVSGTRRDDVIAAQNSRLNGYKTIATDHENRVIIADLILRDLTEERAKNAISE